jgi:hypothetical protein
VVTMKYAVFWGVMSYTSSKNQRFGGTCHRHLLGERISELETLAVTSN